MVSRVSRWDRVGVEWWLQDDRGEPYVALTHNIFLEGFTDEYFAQLRAWEVAMGTQRRVAEVGVGPLWVSTVFLGIDHGYAWIFADDEGKEFAPVLWETMIFRDRGSLGYQERYSSRRDALEGHARAVQWARGWIRSEAQRHVRQGRHSVASGTRARRRLR